MILIICKRLGAITKASEEKGAFLIYQESDVITRVRDYLKDDIGVIQLDTAEAFDQANQFVERDAPFQTQVENVFKRCTFQQVPNRVDRNSI